MRGASAYEPVAGIELSVGDGTVEAPARAWLIEPAGYEAHGRDAAVVAAGAWVRDLCAVIHGPTAAEGKRLTRRLMRTTAVGAEDDDEDDGDYEAGARAVVVEDGAAARPKAHCKGEWVDGYYYVGDGSLMYYDGVCENDPYRPGGARWDAVVKEAEDEGTESRLTC